MSENESTLYWHWAINPVHRQVAVSSFLHAAAIAGFSIGYDVSDPGAKEFAEAAVVMGVFLTPIANLDEPQEGTTFPQAWVGTHGEQAVLNCEKLLRQPYPPCLVLCLPRTPGQLPIELPTAHHFFITGTTFAAADCLKVYDALDAGLGRVY